MLRKILLMVHQSGEKTTWDVKNPAINNGISTTFPSTGEFAGFLNHQWCMTPQLTLTRPGYSHPTGGETFPPGYVWEKSHPSKVLASLYSTVERFSGDLNLNVLKTWESYPNNGPKLGRKMRKIRERWGKEEEDDDDHHHHHHHHHHHVIFDSFLFMLAVVVGGGVFGGLLFFVCCQNPSKTTPNQKCCWFGLPGSHFTSNVFVFFRKRMVFWRLFPKKKG